VINPLAEIAARENAKRELREALELIARDAVGHHDAWYVASTLIGAAFHMKSSRVKKGQLGGWATPALESLRRLQDGRLRTKEDLLREIADRNLSAGTQTNR
jgi:hypothetical protein